MKKSIALIIGMVFSATVFGQLTGDVVKDNRKLVKQGNYVIESHTSGTVVFLISVDAEGNISSARASSSKSTVKSTPAKMNARNYVVSNFKFEPGTWFPEHHQGELKITLVKPKQQL